MPYRSDKQRRYMHARHPEIAARWDKETGGKVKDAKKAGSSYKMTAAAKKKVAGKMVKSRMVKKVAVAKRMKKK